LFTSPSNLTKNIIISIDKSLILKKNNLKKMKLIDGINKTTLISALTTKMLQMKHEPLFFRLWLALVGDGSKVELHRVKSLARMLHYGTWSWIKFHCLQLLSPLSFNFTAFIAHLLQSPKLFLFHIPKSKIKHKTRSRV
jgi:hypothetical protein